MLLDLAVVLVCDGDKEGDIEESFSDDKLLLMSHLLTRLLGSLSNIILKIDLILNFRSFYLKENTLI